MLLRLASILILTWLTTPGYTQKTTLAGTAPGAEGKTLRIIRYADLLTYNEQELATATVDTTGNFKVSFDPGGTILVVLAIDLHRTDMYAVPGMTYRVSGERSLNAMIQQYNAQYDQFLLVHFNELYLERNKALVDTFRVRVNAQFADVDIPYFQDFMTYKTAGLEQVSRALGQAQIVKQYFAGKPVLYDNTEYMQFFGNFFSKYLTSGSMVLRKIDLGPVIKGSDAFHNLMKILATDSLLQDEQLRELVLLKGLMETFYADPSLQEPVLTVIREAETACKYDGNKAVASDMYRKMDRLRPGSPAPAFRLPDMDHKEISLDSLHGKPVLLCFWATYCQGCLTEMEQLSALYPRYKDRIHFVSISADRDFIKMYYFVKMKPSFTWTFLHLNNEAQLLIDYDVKAYPLFVLIDKDGNIIKYPAPAPSEGLSALLDKITGK
jgi:thiol-disulfide isomerase/thioredoxin